MSHPLQQIRDLMQRRDVVRGVVVSIEGSSAKVRTASGIGSYTLSGVAVAPGDSVLLRAGAIAAVQLTGDLPVYNL